MPSLSFSLPACIAALLVLTACGGIEERLDVLRARRIELVREDEENGVDVGKRLAELEARVKQLETTCAQR